MSHPSALVLETSAELLKAVRAPEFILPTLIFPVAFYALFGVMLSSGPDASRYLLATYGIFCVMGPSIFGFGVGVATERDKGWLDLKRAAPTPGVNYIAAKLITTLIFSAVAVALLYCVAGFVARVELPRATWALLFTTHVLSAIPFSLMGLALGFSLKTNGAVAIANLLFMALAVLGGLWFPISMFPALMQKIALVLPSFHLGEVALAVLGEGAGQDLSFHLLIAGIMTLTLAGFSLFCWSRQRS